jgi:putative membrane protein
MLLRDALLAYAHFLAILFLTAVLCAELAVYRQELAAPVARRLQRIDLFFGIAAVVVIVTGVARVVFGLKGADFYLHNPIFWTKMGLFLLVGLLSIAPTVHYLRWNAALSAGADSVRDEPSTYGRIRSLLIAEIVVLAFIPLCAALMSRGL